MNTVGKLFNTKRFMITSEVSPEEQAATFLTYDELFVCSNGDPDDIPPDAEVQAWMDTADVGDFIRPKVEFDDPVTTIWRIA